MQRHTLQTRTTRRGADGQTHTRTETIVTTPDATPTPDAGQTRPVIPWQVWATVAALAGVWLAIATHAR